MRIPQNRKGFSGWKLTKRPQEIGENQFGLSLTGSQAPIYPVGPSLGAIPNRNAANGGLSVGRKHKKKRYTSKMRREANRSSEPAGSVYQNNININTGPNRFNQGQPSVEYHTQPQQYYTT